MEYKSPLQHCRAENDILFLYRVLENSQHFNSDFIINCVEEIETCMTIPEDNTQDSTQDNNQNTEEKN